MNLNDDDRQRADDALLEAMLHSAYHPETAEEKAQLRKVLGNIKSESVAEKIENGSSHSVGNPFPVSDVRGRSTSRARWVAGVLLTSASVILVLVGTLALRPRGADASPQHVLNQIVNSPLQHRTYDLTLVNQLTHSKQHVVQGKLYIDDRDQFALELPGWLGIGNWWMGGAANQRWIVPPLGPAVVGHDSIVGRWLTERDSSMPYMSLNAAAVRLQEKYALRQLSDEIPPEQILPDNRLCHRIVGTLAVDDSVAPDRVDLWADKNSGVVKRIDLKWNRSEFSWGPVKWTVRLSADDFLPEAVFQPETYVRPGQSILNILHESDLTEIDASF